MVFDSFQKQRDPRLNEILFPEFDKNSVKRIIANYEPDQENKENSKSDIMEMCLTLYSIYTCLNTSTEDCFWKHSGKRKNCSKRAISPFPTMFSTQADDCIPICPYFCHHIFICC